MVKLGGVGMDKNNLGNWYYDCLYWLTVLPAKVKCFFLSHNERLGYLENYEEPYCDRCGKINPEDDLNIPLIKENIYWFFVKLIENIKGKQNEESKS